MTARRQPGGVMETKWDGYIRDFGERLPYIPLFNILESFYHYAHDQARGAGKVLDEWECKDTVETLFPAPDFRPDCPKCGKGQDRLICPEKIAAEAKTLWVCFDCGGLGGGDNQGES